MGLQVFTHLCSRRDDMLPSQTVILKRLVILNHFPGKEGSVCPGLEVHSFNAKKGRGLIFSRSSWDSLRLSGQNGHGWNGGVRGGRALAGSV